MEEQEEKTCPCCHKKKVRSEEEYTKLIHRLNRIEGQIRGIRGMVEKSAYCPDILVQVAAVNAALHLTENCYPNISAPVWLRIFERVTMKSLKNWLPRCKS